MGWPVLKFLSVEQSPQFWGVLRVPDQLARRCAQVQLRCRWGGGPEHLQARKRGGMELIQSSDPPCPRPPGADACHGRLALK